MWFLSVEQYIMFRNVILDLSANITTHVAVDGWPHYRPSEVSLDPAELYVKQLPCYAPCLLN